MQRLGAAAAAAGRNYTPPGGAGVGTVLARQRLLGTRPSGFTGPATAALIAEQRARIAAQQQSWWQRLLASLATGGAQSQYGGGRLPPRGGMSPVQQTLARQMLYNTKPATVGSRNPSASRQFSRQRAVASHPQMPPPPGYAEMGVPQPTQPYPSYGYGGYPSYGYGGYGGGYGGGGNYTAPTDYPYQQAQGAGMQVALPQGQFGYQQQDMVPRWLQKLTTWTY